tara:strand:+ start:471 stop:1271 length:801 start_codon:yes stop_codon:yes gene_type:complete
VKVSCLLPTYNRFPKSSHLVEEAIESFLRQDHSEKELIILNDCPGQELIFEHPDVFVLNTSKRFRTMGEKLNAGFALATGEVLCRFDDDDISLPHRLSLGVRKLKEKGLSYWGSLQYFFDNGKTTRISKSGAPSKSIWTREAFDAVGGFPHVDSGQDSDFQKLVKDHDPEVFEIEDVTFREIFYVYRWGTGSVHLSGFGRGSEGYEKIGKRPIESGTYELNPNWRKEYQVELLNKKDECEFCGETKDEGTGKYGCPNCHGEGLETL